MTTKSKSTHHAVQVRDTLGAGAQQSKEALETFSAAASEATQAVQESCTTAIKGMQEYSGKVMQFTQANIKSSVDFVQKLATTKSPSEFVELSTNHTRRQFETMAEQVKELTELAQRVTREAAESLNTEFSKTPIAPRE